MIKNKTIIYLFLICAIGVIAPFVHIIYGISDAPGVFGYDFMSTFLYSLGHRVSLLCAGLLLLFAHKQITNQYKTVFKFIAYMMLYVASYFLIQTFIQKKIIVEFFGINDYHPMFYFVSVILLAISSVFVLTLFQKAFIYSEEKIVTLVNFLFKVRNNHYEIMAIKALYAEKENPPIDGVEAIEQVKEFEDEFHNAIERVTKYTKESNENSL